MIEIIPNWHPLLVHFTVGLLSTSSLFYVASAFLPNTNSWRQQWLNMANWSLWSGCLFAIGTAIAGWLAYNSVAHDSISHAAMTLHRNWALPTASTFLLLGLWAILNAGKNHQPGFLFITFSVVAAILLMVTGWLGAEAVYRYGLGVKSLPVIMEGADGHNHKHGSEHNESSMAGVEHLHDTTKIEKTLTEDSYEHTHNNKEIHHNKIEQMLKQDGHQHEHKSKNTLSIIKKTLEPTIQSSAIKSHTHDSNSLEPIAILLDQNNKSEEPLLSPSELYSLYHNEVQNEEAVTTESHSHDEANEH